MSKLFDSALAPAVSSEVVMQVADSSAAMALCVFCYGGILLILLLNSLTERKQLYFQSDT